MADYPVSYSYNKRFGLPPREQDTATDTVVLRSTPKKGQCYAMQDGMVYLVLAEGPIKMDVDAKTFKVVDVASCLAKDARHAYWYDHVIAGADPASFASLASDFRAGTYSKDARHLFRNDAVVATDADISSLRMITGNQAVVGAADAHAVYLIDPKTVGETPDGSSYNFGTFTRKVPGADPSRFRFLGACYLSGAEGSISENDYYTDGAHVFADNRMLPSVDAASFTYLGSYAPNGGGMGFAEDSYAKDARAVYRDCGSVIAGADPASFTVLGGGYAKDKNAIYFDGRVLAGADQASFVFLDYGYAKDAHTAYLFGRKIAGADALTFHHVNECEGGNADAVDAHHAYQLGQVVEGLLPSACR